MLAQQGIGQKPNLTFVLCPEKDLVLVAKKESAKDEGEEEVNVPVRKVQMQIIAKETLIEEEAMK